MSAKPSANPRLAALLSVALCFWLYAFASHVHAHDEARDHGKAPAHCSVCLSMPAGAPAPEVLAISLEPVVVARITALAVIRVGDEVPSSYLSRGPPAS